MATDEIIHNLANIGEHTSCRNFKIETGSGFKYMEIRKGESFQTKSTTENYIFFILEGEWSITCNEFAAKDFKNGEMILIPKTASLKVSILTDSKILVFKFDTISSGCDRFALQSYEEYCANVRYNFNPTPIRKPLDTFLDQMVYYLNNGMDCVHLHEIKEKELFLLLRKFYQPDELADFFHPIIGKSLDFRQFVMRNYENVKSVEELVKLSMYGRSSFFSKFKREFGMSVKEWMLNQKSKQVLLKLSDPDVTVKSVMDEFEFDSYEQFNRFCKKHYHNTPSALLKVLKRKQ
ncbi:MAG: AraC family transcriptional regulator [Bacteroidales bacterium]|jgi:AraC-like DNA-binding protein/mannose-6-phosphate isomerase-like protein (cupin superfamily)|nr:AraC family transcriptional regulator [Bacteroidales bacterium]MCI2122187.1 AraC family transcriptional regulator [Bacteroidales bacterium]MCI2145593.1 AraC family transcriptional regulator [Bacteroidales bacterium]